MTIKCLQIQFTLMDLLNEPLCAWNKVTVLKPGMKSADPKQRYYLQTPSNSIIMQSLKDLSLFLNTVQEKSAIKVSVKSVS